jgi:hypothetical protein
MSACCELIALGWRVRPDVAQLLSTPEECDETLAELRDLWRMACDECRQENLLPVAREVELEKWAMLR